MTVNEGNDPPTIDPIPDPAAINEDAGAQIVNLTGITAGPGETQPLQVTAVSDNLALIPNPAVTYTSPNATGSLQYTPVANAFGTANVTVTVTDGGLDGNLATAGDNGTTTETFQVTVNGVNDPPTIDPIPDPAAINEDAPQQTVNLTGITAGPGESQPLQVTAVSDNTALIPNPAVTYTSPNATGSLQYTPVANSFGTANITVTVTDGGLDGNLATAGDNGTTTDTFVVTVNDANDPPTLDPIADPAAINEDAPQQTVNLTGITAGTGETQPLQVTAVSDNTALIPNPTVIYTSPNATGSLQYTPVANAFGTANITVTVTDGGPDGNLATAGDNLTTSDTFLVTVNAVNDQPSFDVIPNPAAINEDDPQQTVNVTGITAGPGEGTQPLQLTATSNNTSLIPNPTVNYTSPNGTGSLQYTPVANAFGTATITVTLTDGGADNNLATAGDNLTFQRTFDVVVNSVNDVPQINPAALRETFHTIGNTAFEFKAAQSLIPGVWVAGKLLDHFLPDPDGPAALTVTLGTATPGAEVVIAPDGSFSYIPPPGATGSDTFTYSVSDGMDAVVRTVTINLVERVWYVRNNAPAGGDGQSDEPFDTLVEAQTASGPNDFIFVYFGDGTNLGHTAGIVLKNGQRLLGEHVGLSVPIPAGFNGLGAPGDLSLVDAVEAGDPEKRPRIGDPAGNGVSATDAVPLAIAGVNIAASGNAIHWTTAAAFAGNNTGLTIRDIVVRSAGGKGVNILLQGTGALRLAFRDNDLTSTGTGLDIQETGTGSLTITDFLDNEVFGNTGGTGINIVNAIFNSNPGGPVVNVNGNSLLIGSIGIGNGVGGSGLVMTGVQGSLSFGALAIYADSGAGLRVAGTAPGMTFGVTVAGMATVEATGGPAVDISGTALNLPLGILKSTNSPTTGVALNSVSGSFSAATGSSITNITNTTGTAFQVGNSSVTVDYDGTVTTNQGKGVDLTGNTGTISLDGLLTLTTGTNTAFNATGGGTVTAINTANTLSSTTGAALNVVNTTIGAGGLKFQSISANGAANGIVLNNTGTSAGLTVSGTGTTDGSGGTIQNTSGNGIVLTSTRFANLKNMIVGDATATAGQAANGTNNIGGNGIALNGADDVTLDNIKIARTAAHGIDGTGVTNLTITNSEIFNAGDSNEDSALDFSDLNQNNLDGTVQITNTVIDAFAEDGIFVENFSGTLTMTVSGSTLGNSTNTLCGGSTCGENGIQIRSDGTASYTLTVNGSTQFNSVDGNGILAVAEGTAVTPSVVNISNTTFTNTKALGIVLFGGTGDATSTIQSRMNFTIGPSVSLTGTTATAVSIQPNGKSTMRGTVTAAVNGSQIGRGIEVLSDDASTGVVSILNSSVSNTAFNGIFASNQNQGKLDIHIRNNTVSAPLDTVPASGLAVHGTEINVRETSVNCLDIANNQSAGHAASGGAGYRTRQRDTSTFNLERFVGNGTSTADVQTFLTGQNTSGTASATVNTTYTGVANGFCEDP